MSSAAGTQKTKRAERDSGTGAKRQRHSETLAPYIAGPIEFDYEDAGTLVAGYPDLVLEVLSEAKNNDTVVLLATDPATRANSVFKISHVAYSDETPKDADSDDALDTAVFEASILYHIKKISEHSHSNHMQQIIDAFSTNISAAAWSRIVKAANGERLSMSQVFEAAESKLVAVVNQPPGAPVARHPPNTHVLVLEYIASIPAGPLFLHHFTENTGHCTVMTAYLSIVDSLRHVHKSGIFHGDCHLLNMLLREPVLEDRARTDINLIQNTVIDFGRSCIIAPGAHPFLTCDPDEELALMHTHRLVNGERQYERVQLDSKDIVGRCLFDYYYLASSFIFTLEQFPDFKAHLKPTFLDIVYLHRAIFIDYYRTFRKSPSLVAEVRDVSAASTVFQNPRVARLVDVWKPEKFKFEVSWIPGGDKLSIDDFLYMLLCGEPQEREFIARVSNFEWYEHFKRIRMPAVP
jgi:serine/threonine protein kinase